MTRDLPGDSKIAGYVSHSSKKPVTSCFTWKHREDVSVMMHHDAGYYYYETKHEYERKRVAVMPVSNYAYGDLFKFCWCSHIALTST